MAVKAPLLLAFLALASSSLAVACGGTTAGGAGAPDSGGCGPAPPEECAGACGGPGGAPECISGSWTCPAYGVDCAVDSGTRDAGADAADASCGPPPPEDCAGPCGGPGGGPTCIDGSWTCPVYGIDCALDSGVDSGDASVLFACDSLMCNAATEYCSISGGGAQPLDGGSNLTVACDPLPPMPCDAGTGCACITGGCGCTDDGGAITSGCLFP
jgi:hypothetical protein